MISLNCWFGKVLDPLLSFIREQAPVTDIFCFQEVFSLHSGSCVLGDDTCYNLFARISEALPGFRGFYAPIQAGYGLVGRSPCDVSFGQAMFVRGTIPEERHGDTFVYRERNGFCDGDPFNLLPRTVQFVEFVAHGTRYTVCNFHGLAT